MNCTEAYDAILDADPAIVRGEGAGALAQHLRECVVCRERARRVMDGLGALDHALSVDAGAARAWRRRRARPPVVRRIAPWGLVAGIAAAAVILLQRPGAPRRPAAAAPARAAVAVDVDVAASARLAAVLRTADPNITVVWFF